jgi:hypothetical protein
MAPSSAQEDCSNAARGREKERIKFIFIQLFIVGIDLAMASDIFIPCHALKK